MFGKKKFKPLSRADFKSVQGSYIHAGGLPVPEGTQCNLTLTETGLSIYGAGASFNLSIDKMISISTKTDEEVQKQLVSSTGKAIAGAALFGVAGAVIGGQPKEKQKTVYKNYMVITYKKDSDIAYLVFSLAGTPMEAMPFIQNFGLLTLDRAKETIEL